MRILVTRPEPDATATAGRLTALGAFPVVAPLMTLRPIAGDLPGAQAVAALAISSANALRALADRHALDPYRHLPVFAVGEHSAAVARDLGFAQVTSAGGTLADLAALLVRAAPQGPVLYPMASDVSGDLAALLAPSGLVVEPVRVYRMAAAEALPDAATAGLADGSIGAVLLYSRRSAQIFAALAAPLLTSARRTSLTGLAIAQAAADPLEALGLRCAVAAAPSEEAMMAVCRAYLAGAFG